jgi:hypothetical protein
MSKYKVLRDFSFEGVSHTTNQEIDLDEKKAAELVRENKIELI